MQNFRALGAPPPDPRNSPPHCEFLATRLSMFLVTFETLAKQGIQRVVFDLLDQMGGFGGQRNKEAVCIQYII